MKTSVRMLLQLFVPMALMVGVLGLGLLQPQRTFARSAVQTTNLALNKPATASSALGGNTANLAFDGNVGSRWESLHGVDPSWVQVDLGATYNLTSVKLVWEPAYATAFQIQISGAATGPWTNIYSTTTGTGGTQTLAVTGTGQYVRMNGTARALPYGYSLWEFEVYGTSGSVTATHTVTRTFTPVGATNTPTGGASLTRTNTPGAATATSTATAAGCGATNIALNKLAISSSNENAGTTPNLAVDGNAGTRWSSAASDPQWIQIDLGSPQSICRVKLTWETAYATAYQIQVSNDAVTWTNIYSTTTGDGGTDDLTGLSGSGRYIRMNGTVRATVWGYSLWEFESYTGSSGPTAMPSLTATQTRTNTITGPTNTPTATMTPASGQSAYPSGVAWAIPGTIQVENFDLGGETVAYHDNDAANTGGQYRTTDGVDIEVSTDTGGGYSIGWTRTGEWLEYTVNVATSGNYILTERVASGATTGSFRVEFNGVDKTGAVAVPNTGGWQTWMNLSQTVSLSSGVQIMRIYFIANDANLNYLSLSGGGPTNTPTASNTPNGLNHQPNTPSITEPTVEGKVVNPGDVHMETGPFFDQDAGQVHVCTDWEIWNAALTERVWFTSCIGGIEKVHTHLGDGVFQGSLAGRTDLLPNTNYVLRARHKDNSGDSATEWSAYVQRGFVTSSVSVGNPNQLWGLPQAGYEVQVAATGFQLPVNIAFIPNPGTQPTSPLYYVTELYGTIKVVTRAGAVSDYVTGLLNYNPTGNFPGSGEQGVTGLAIDPATGDLFAGMLYEATGGNHYPKVVRFHSTNGGMTAATQTVILDMAGETQGQSHQISNFSVGPDGKLYVHMGDGFDASKGQNLTSFRGKILRMNLDGSAPTDNPLYNAADGITARDYVFAYGFRNPFGGAWRASDNAHYEVENGPGVDRFVKVVANRNYLYDGSDASMSNFAIYTWNSARAPVNMAFIQAQTFNGSGFPASKMDHVFISESGPTYATGPQGGKRIAEFVLDANGNLLSGPTTILEYTGVGKATVVALAAGPDGLYFSDLYKDLNYVSPIDRGANIYRLKYVGP